MRPLTEAERRKSVAAKQAANVVIRAERRKLAAEIEWMQRRALSGWQYKEKELNRLQPVTGLPVLLSSGDKVVCVDYEKLRKLISKLKPQDWSREFSLTQGAIGCRYENRWAPDRRGRFELYELPQHQRMLLHDLPVIELGG